MLSPINDFGRKNLQSSQVLAILSDVFKLLREEICIPSDEKEISWEDFFEMSHKIVRMSRRFFASKHKQPQNELISCDFINKTAIFKGAEDSVHNLCVSSKVLIFVVEYKSNKNNGAYDATNIGIIFHISLLWRSF